MTEMILRFFGGRYHELYDDMYKAGYLTISEAEPFYARGLKQLESVKKGPSIHLRLSDSVDRELSSYRGDA